MDVTVVECFMSDFESGFGFLVGVVEVGERCP